MAILAVATALLLLYKPFPSDTTPEGAYLRIGLAVSKGHVEDAFAYLEDDAQHAVYSAWDYCKKSRDRIRAAYPESVRSAAEAPCSELAGAQDGPGAFRILLSADGRMGLLTQDLSGIHTVQTEGERATVETARGTRHAFRRRSNGIWGLTLFTSTFRAEAAKRARDFEVIDANARDYQRAAEGRRAESR